MELRVIVENNIPKYNFGLLGSSESSLPYKEMDLISSEEIEETNLYTVLNNDDSLNKTLEINV
jgi:hypothetical protein